jgi:hypothetical protein
LPTRRTLVLGASVAVAALGAGALRGYWTYEAWQVGQSLARKARFQIVTTDLQRRIGPKIILPTRPAALTDLASGRLTAALQSLDAALAPYPQGFADRFLDTVALAGEIVFWRDTRIGGFFFPRGLCVNAGDDADDDKMRQGLFHHELSSLVRMARAPDGRVFDEAAWGRINPPGFHYLDEAAYRNLLRAQPHERGDDDLHALGFMRPYGESDIDNDWNTYAEAVFSDGEGFARLIRPFGRMRAKTAMLIDWYRRFDPAIDGYFAQTGVAAAIR